MVMDKVSSLPCQIGVAWALLLAALGLIAAYVEFKETNKTSVNWFIVFSSAWLLSMQVAFWEGILNVFGYTLPAWIETIFSVVYPIVFIGTALLAFIYILRGIFGKD